MSITIQAKDFNGNKCEASVGDILFGAFVIDTQRADGLFTPVTFIDDAAEMESYFEDLDSDAWDAECQNMNRAETAGREYRAWLADDSHLSGLRV